MADDCHGAVGGLRRLVQAASPGRSWIYAADSEPHVRLDYAFVPARSRSGRSCETGKTPEDQGVRSFSALSKSVSHDPIDEQGGPDKARLRSDEHRVFGNTGLQVPVVDGTWKTFDVRGKAVASVCS